MPLVLPETQGDEILALLSIHPDLEAFSLQYSDVDTPEDRVTNTHASAKKGEICLLHVDRTPEELGVRDGETVYTEIDEWDLVVMIGLRNPATQLAVLRAVEQCLRGVKIASATGRIEFTGGFRRITDRKADTVQAFLVAFRTSYDNLLDQIGYSPVVTGYGHTNNPTPFVTV